MIIDMKRKRKRKRKIYTDMAKPIIVVVYVCSNINLEMKDECCAVCTFFMSSVSVNGLIRWTTESVQFVEQKLINEQCFVFLL